MGGVDSSWTDLESGDRQDVVNSLSQLELKGNDDFYKDKGRSVTLDQ